MNTHNMKIIHWVWRPKKEWWCRIIGHKWERWKWGLYRCERCWVHGDNQ